MTRDYSKATPTDHQRRPESIRDDDWIRALLHKGEIARLAHLSGKQPFISPTNYWFDEENHQLLFHSSLVGRREWTRRISSTSRWCKSKVGRLLPSNSGADQTVERLLQVLIGKVTFLEDNEEKLRGLYGILNRYFPELKSGRDYKPISEKELKGTNVYVVKIESWSGKENWKERAKQVDDWPPLPEKVLKP